MLSEPLLVVARLARTFDDLAIRYFVAGSLASSLYGIPRATQDVDLVADIGPPHVEHLMSALAGEFYIDAGMIRDAIRGRASFNVIHLATMFKADIFITGDDVWSREEMSRARTEEFDTSAGKVAIRFASAEDTVLRKLVWYKLGDCVSDRQWGDQGAGRLTGWRVPRTLGAVARRLGSAGPRKAAGAGIDTTSAESSFSTNPDASDGVRLARESWLMVT
jgi:hypothetical protein